MKIASNGLAGLLRAALGARWQQLHPQIRARFTLAPGKTQQSFAGSMSQIDRSACGWVIAKLIAFVRILPSQRARHVPFEFNLRPAQRDISGGWIKQRIYRFRGGDFEFRSVMRIAPNGELIEQFPYGLGMKIRLGAEGHNGDTLMFRDDGYFLRLGQFRLPLPRWLTVGRFTLAHKNIDREHFSVEISIDHPLLGQLFYQYGRFRESPLRAHVAGAAVSGQPRFTPSRQPSA
jgi:hypothetical protein